MEKSEVRELPKRIVPMSLESEKLGEFNTLYKLMVEAYARLPFYLGEEALPLNPKEITGERLRAYIEKMSKRLNEEQKKVWQKLYSDAIMHIKTIRKFFDAFPDAEFEVIDNISTPKEKRITCINKIAVIRAVSEIDMPKDCCNYFAKVQALANALNEMREFEKSHGLKQQPADEMPYYAIHADEFAQKYIGGYFQKK